ncbi:MAG: tyrosine-type recombinase/integrase [Methanocorpusculum sp.]|nr:tyrosine-type recombinase/integrase [Methanocorpusculum sp.]
MMLPSEFLAFTQTETTTSTYKAALVCYLREVTGGTVLREQLDSAWQDYLRTCPDIEHDVLIFIKKCRAEQNFAPKTTCLYTQILIQFLRESGVGFSARTLRLLKSCSPKNYPVTRERELTKEEIARLLNSADIRLRAEILVAVSSGMRIGELLSFSARDVNFNVSPVEIYLSDMITKTKTARTVFISGEAAEALRRWLAERKEIPAEKRISPRCFPYSVGNETARFRQLLQRTGLFEVDTRTSRTTIHFHLFRKFFLTEFKLAASAEVAEELAGHAGYLSQSYRRLTRREMQTEYMKAEPKLTVACRLTVQAADGGGRKGEACRQCVGLEKEVGDLKLEIRNLISLIRTPGYMHVCSLPAPETRRR